MMNQDEYNKIVDSLPDDVLGNLVASMPWADPSGIGEARVVDSDGFEISPMLQGIPADFRAMQNEIWRKYVLNPQISSYIRDYMGRLTGAGFGMGSDHPVINDKIKEIVNDPRNALYTNMTKFAGRSEIEGELFLCATVHRNGFIEVDFMDPSILNNVGRDGSGIYYHKNKTQFPLFYEFIINGDKLTKNETVVIPSINVAYFPELATSYRDFKELLAKNLEGSRSRSKSFTSIGGFHRFILQWDKSLLTSRNVSHIQTTIVWINHYENLKKWEIDHKRSSGSYLWVANIEDSKAFRTWLKMTDEQKKSTGLMAKKKPGGTLVLPPGIKLQCINPSLPSISDTDTDIMNMVISGLNQPEDMVTGVTKGSTFSGVKASRGPQADRVADQIEYFRRFLIYDFWRPIFFLSASVSSFPKKIKIREAVDFKDKKPVFKQVEYEPYELVDIEFPSSEISDMESQAKGLLGVKHGSLIDALGISRGHVAKRFGIHGYKRKRLMAATEEEIYPELPSALDMEQLSNKVEDPEKQGNTPDSEKKPATAPSKKQPVKPAKGPKQ